MSPVLVVERAGPMTTIQDRGRFGKLAHGVSASGPMDTGSFELCGSLLGQAGTAAIEFTAAGMGLRIEGSDVRAVAAGGAFKLALNSRHLTWPSAFDLRDGDRIEITPGPVGNYGYLRFSQEIDIPLVLGSRATSSIARLGGLDGRALVPGDRLQLVPARSGEKFAPPQNEETTGRVRILWGIHVDLFSSEMRRRFIDSPFIISPHLNRMGVRLVDPSGVFAGQRSLSLTSDAIVPGDIQILGDGTPTILMRDHQPTGGYPRIATVISADFDRVAQMRPGQTLTFAPVTLATAHHAAGFR